MKFEEFQEWFYQELALKASANTSSREDEFIKYVTEKLIEADEFEDFTDYHFEGTSRRNGAMQIDGFSLNEADDSCCIFISVYKGVHNNESIGNEEITASFNRIRRFVEEAIKDNMYENLEESTSIYELAEYLYNYKKSITKYRFFLLTDAINKQRKKNIKDIEIAEVPVELNVWDITRIYDLINADNQKENIEIVLSDFGSNGIPCVKAVEYTDVKADIDILNSYIMDAESGNNSQPNIITYSSYLAVVPGKLLNELYLEYGSRLLEGNVRSYLSARGKVNKSIQNTIKNYPEMFFAYNNGIAATATELDVVHTSDGMVITKIINLQIVNGGQTTASIANTILTAKSSDNVDISRLYVPMKISVLEHSMAERIIPKISEYSNSQNKVDSSDFFSNHPFHIRIENFSKKIPAPSVEGNQYNQYWYYERTRGQYNQGKMKFRPKSKEMKLYELKYPEEKVIKMVELAKYMEIYAGEPHIVSKGKQEVVRNFAEKIKKNWAVSEKNYNEYYFKRCVALAIIYKETDEIIKQTAWYKEKHSFKANVAAYTLSILFDYIKHEKKGFEFDFLRIWKTQKIYPELEEQIRRLCTEVYYFITRNDRKTENVTQWCKQQLCWFRAKEEKWSITLDFLDTLIDTEEVNSERKVAKQLQKMDSELEAVSYIYQIGPKYWEKVYSWGVEKKLLSDMEKDILTIIINMKKNVTTRQARAMIKTRERLIKEGMPMTF